MQPQISNAHILQAQQRLLQQATTQSQQHIAALLKQGQTVSAQESAMIQQYYMKKAQQSYAAYIQQLQASQQNTRVIQSGSIDQSQNNNMSSLVHVVGFLPEKLKELVQKGTMPLQMAQYVLAIQKQYGGPENARRAVQAMALQQQRGAPQSLASQRSNMRVQIDLRNRADLDTTFVAEDMSKAFTKADDVVRRCEMISHNLLRVTGNSAAVQAIDYKELTAACGDTAKFLKQYQLVGINFLLLIYRSKVGGAILADEMGLGKTAQLINYLGTIRSMENDPGPHLVVVPASLLENWQRELRRWCPSLKTVVYYGKHRKVIRKRLKDLKEHMAKGEAVDDDLEDLTNPEALANMAHEAAMEELMDEDDDDPLGLDAEEEREDSDDDFDIQREEKRQKTSSLSGTGGSSKALNDEPPPQVDIEAPPSLAPFNIMLTCYTLFERGSPEQAADRAFLEGWRWSHLIMDEAHALKNKNAQRVIKLRRVANVSRRRIMMTGTPLQNDLAELQNLLLFLLPHVFAAQGFEFENFAELIHDDRKVRDLTERMKSLLSPFCLRRLKAEVSDQLTEKSHKTEFIAMTSQQAELYEGALSSMRSSIASGKAAGAIQDKSEKGYEKFLKSLGGKKISHMFTHLRKIAQHPLLVRSFYDEGTVNAIAHKAVELNLFSGNATLKRVTDELLSYSDYSLHAFCYNAGVAFHQWKLPTSAMMSSGKFQFLGELLQQLKEQGSRPLIFSQWTSILDIIEWLLDDMRLPYVRLDGSTAVDERLATVDRFNTSSSTEVFAFLLSTRAGGQGLNLTGADTVVIHDVDFNPQIDRQAEDRCHRLGQTRPVKVYRLVCKQTVDQNIYNLSQQKLKLDAAVLDGITAGKGAKNSVGAEEKQQIGKLLHTVLAGSDAYEVDVEEEAEKTGQKAGEREVGEQSIRDSVEYQRTDTVEDVSHEHKEVDGLPPNLLEDLEVRGDVEPTETGLLTDEIEGLHT